MYIVNSKATTKKVESKDNSYAKKGGKMESYKMLKQKGWKLNGRLNKMKILEIKSIITEVNYCVSTLD